MELPSIILPNPTTLLGPLELPKPTLSEPTASLPSYQPMFVPPSDLKPPVGVPTVEMEEQVEKEEKRKEEGKPPPKPVEASEIRRINLPFTDFKFPLPKEEILVTAGTTATVSVVATLTATSVFNHTVKVMKPLIQQLVKRIQKKLNGTKT